MKKFLLNVLSSAAGVFIAIAIIIVFSLMMVIAPLVASGRSSIAAHSVLRLDLKGVLSERASSNPLVDMNLQSYNPSLEEMLRAIDVAKHNKNIDGIYISAGVLEASPASLEELRRAIVEFRKSGKFVVSYSGTYTQGAYYVCSAASEILMNPAGELEWRGLGGEMMFYKDLLDKVGVKMQVVRVGTYKSYVELYTSTAMSPANKEQVSRYLGSIWDHMLANVALSRKIPTTTLNAYADKYMALQDSRETLRSGLIDSLAYGDQALMTIARKTGKDKISDINFVRPADLFEATDDNTAGGEVAVYYATGSIVDSNESGFGTDNSIVAANVIKDLRDLAEDDDVKAVVLRINSGGGSAYASEQLWRAVKQLSKAKPVVVSMSDMAASGAYYMSSAADYIVAEPTTLTGSIGIFGMIPDVSTLMNNKLGIHFDGVKTNAHSDFFSMSRPLNPSEMTLMQSYVDRGYALFLKRVAEGRKMSVAAVDKIAQGRVWTGKDALGIKLVDKLGNLSDAVGIAAKRAGLKEYHAAYYPAQQQWWEQLITERGNFWAQSQLRSYLGEMYPVFSMIKDIKSMDRVQARIPYNPVIR